MPGDSIPRCAAHIVGTPGSLVAPRIAQREMEPRSDGVFRTPALFNPGSGGCSRELGPVSVPPSGLTPPNVHSPFRQKKMELESRLISPHNVLSASGGRRPFQ